MPFPPNYRQDKNNRTRAKERKALEKQARREEKSNLRHRDRKDDAPAPGEPMQEKVE
jgi:hypothetical protein